MRIEYCTRSVDINAYHLRQKVKQCKIYVHTSPPFNKLTPKANYIFSFSKERNIIYSTYSNIKFVISFQDEKIKNIITDPQIKQCPNCMESSNGTYCYKCCKMK
ncbi:hypothetical protein CHS0354_026905 [Potamilus streckersoni]|uniref:Uncharacterized protein n=1 Tax=Potamilus streckersoni TaxID=2493646 RepID=A0AAE0SP50_9BIVA|nr:hypothetical protein CHS0354_026905 [Potamilus streckersoni]